MFSGSMVVAWPALARSPTDAGECSTNACGRGTPGNDVLTGTPNADKITSGGGNDRLLGLGGNDVLSGGKGRDIAVGAAGTDRLMMRDASAIQSLRAWTRHCRR